MCASGEESIRGMSSIIAAAPGAVIHAAVQTSDTYQRTLRAMEITLPGAIPFSHIDSRDVRRRIAMRRVPQLRRCSATHSDSL